MLVMVGGSGREREKQSFQDGAGKVQDEPRHLVVTDRRTCLMNHGDMSI